MDPKNRRTTGGLRPARPPPQPHPAGPAQASANPPPRPPGLGRPPGSPRRAPGAARQPIQSIAGNAGPVRYPLRNRGGPPDTQQQARSNVPSPTQQPRLPQPGDAPPGARQVLRPAQSRAPAFIPPIRREHHQNCSISPNASVDEGNYQRLAWLQLDSHGHTPMLNGEAVDVQESLRADRKKDARVLQAEYAQWLASNHTWNQGRLGNGWVGTRVLGRGGNGIAGLWEYRGKKGREGKPWGADEDMDDEEESEEERPPPYLSAMTPAQRRARIADNIEKRRKEKLGITKEKKIPNNVNKVVIKQQRAAGSSGLMHEGEVLALMNTTGSEHFPTMYKRVYRDAGSGVPGMRIDSDRREVHRMFMEFLPGGDMNDLIVKLISQGPDRRGWKFLREDAVWSAFDCLVRGFMAAQWGDENIEDEADLGDWEGSGIVHFDIKPLNIFVGTRSEGLHSTLPIHKIGDWGLATWPGNVENQGAEERRRYSQRGTRFTLAPEQFRQSHRAQILPDGSWLKYPNKDLNDDLRKYGPWTNVYGIGCCMYMLMCLTYNYPATGPAYVSSLSPELQQGECLGEEIEYGMWPPRWPRYQRGKEQGMPVPDDDGNLPQRIPLPYSKALKVLVMRCLMENYTLRPTIFDLCRGIEEGAADADDILADEDPNDPQWANMEDEYPEDNSPARQAPIEWLTETPTDYWESGSVMYGQRNERFKMLPSVRRAQVRDFKRKEQVYKARAMAGWAPGADEPPNAPRPQGPRGHKHGRDEFSDDEEDTTDVLPAVKRRAIAKPRQRQQMFTLTIHVFDHQNPNMQRLTERWPISLNMTIQEFRTLLDGHNLPFKAAEARVARPKAIIGTEGWDLPDNMIMKDAALPVREGGEIQLRSTLEVHRDKVEVKQPVQPIQDQPTRGPLQNGAQMLLEAAMMLERQNATAPDVEMQGVEAAPQVAAVQQAAQTGPNVPGGDDVDMTGQ